MGHGLYGALKSIDFPWVMDRTAHLGVLISHGTWTVWRTREYWFPMGHGPYGALKSIDFPWVVDRTAHLGVLISHGTWTVWHTREY